MGTCDGKGHCDGEYDVKVHSDGELMEGDNVMGIPDVKGHSDGDN
ncbi:unnamed protein product [Staurois parvus]|uniref:Uncharacterized protein n=1 Tax=Staurois parvus TaxID=386267 RepID=A0ABN9G600_9NEOB|nr:unnamed protein product [Staurois parvus]